MFSPAVSPANAPERRKTRARNLLAAAAAVAIGGAAVVIGTGLPANAAISGVALAVSTNVASATGVTYTWVFTPGTTSSTLTNLTLTVPTGTTWTPAAATTFGITGCTVPTPSYSAPTVTIAMTGCTVTQNRPVSVSITGVTNGPATASFSSVVTTTGTGGETGTAGTAISLAANTTAVTVLVPQSLTFSNDTTAVTLLPIPGGSLTTAAPVTLGVSTNAVSGYTLKAYQAVALTKGAPAATIASLAPNTTTDLTTGTGFGAMATATGATLSAPWSTTTSSLYAGYPTSDSGAGSTVATNAGPTANDQIVLTNGVRIAATQAAGTYTGTITYVVTPSF